MSTFEPKYDILLRWEKRDRVFVAEVPELPGCLAHGQTRQMALQAAEKAIVLWVQSAKEEGRVIPEPTGSVLPAGRPDD